MSAISFKRQNAQQTPYTPANPANWPVVPDTVAEGLDSLASETAASVGFQVEQITVTSGNILSSSFTLGSTPTLPAQTMLFPLGGPIQSYGVDYQITGNVLSWFGLGLATKIEVGDRFVVHYKV